MYTPGYLPLSHTYVLMLFCRYRNGAVQPQGNMQRIDFVVNDGTFNSSIVSAHIYISPVNDLPQVYLAHSSVDVYLMYTEGQSGPLSLAPNATITGEMLRTVNEQSNCSLSRSVQVQSNMLC